MSKFPSVAKQIRRDVGEDVHVGPNMNGVTFLIRRIRNHIAIVDILAAIVGSPHSVSRSNRSFNVDPFSHERNDIKNFLAWNVRALHDFIDIQPCLMLDFDFS